MVTRRIEKFRQFIFNIEHRAGTKIPQADCLSRINTEDYELTAFVNAIAADAEENSNHCGGRGWQLDKL